MASRTTWIEQLTRPEIALVCQRVAHAPTHTAAACLVYILADTGLVRKPWVTDVVTKICKRLAAPAALDDLRFDERRALRACLAAQAVPANPAALAMDKLRDLRAVLEKMQATHDRTGVRSHTPGEAEARVAADVDAIGRARTRAAGKRALPPVPVFYDRILTEPEYVAGLSLGQCRFALDGLLKLRVPEHPWLPAAIADLLLQRVSVLVTTDWAARHALRDNEVGSWLAVGRRTTPALAAAYLETTAAPTRADLVRAYRLSLDPILARALERAMAERLLGSPLAAAAATGAAPTGRAGAVLLGAVPAGGRGERVQQHPRVPAGTPAPPRALTLEDVRVLYWLSQGRARLARSLVEAAVDGIICGLADLRREGVLLEAVATVCFLLLAHGVRHQNGPLLLTILKEAVSDNGGGRGAAGGLGVEQQQQPQPQRRFLPTHALLVVFAAMKAAGEAFTGTLMARREPRLWRAPTAFYDILDPDEVPYRRTSAAAEEHRLTGARRVGLPPVTTLGVRAGADVDVDAPDISEPGDSDGASVGTAALPPHYLLNTCSDLSVDRAHSLLAMAHAVRLLHNAAGGDTRTTDVLLWHLLRTDWRACAAAAGIYPRVLRALPREAAVLFASVHGMPTPAPHNRGRHPAAGTHMPLDLAGFIDTLSTPREFGAVLHAVCA